MNEITRLRDRIEELECENKRLRDFLFRQQHQFAPELGLTRLEQRFLSVLLARSPAFVDRETLLAAVYRDANDTPEDKIVDVVICRIRRKLNPIKIESQWGIGYRVSPEAAGSLKGHLLPQELQQAA